MYSIDDIITSANYDDAALWCLRNNAMLQECGRGRYRIVPVPQPTDEERAILQRRNRNDAIDAIMWRVQRYEQQACLGIATTDSENTYLSILSYIQYLRDLPTLPEFLTQDILSFDEYLESKGGA